MILKPQKASFQTLQIRSCHRSKNGRNAFLRAYIRSFSLMQFIIPFGITASSESLHRFRKYESEIKQIQDTELSELREELSEITGIFKGKERKAIEAKMETAERTVSDLKDRISRMVQEHGYPDGQTFMAAYNKAESIVKRYEWELAEWKQRVEGKPAEEKKPLEHKSILIQLHRIREEAQKPSKRSSRDRDER